MNNNENRLFLSVNDLHKLNRELFINSDGVVTDTWRCDTNNYLAIKNAYYEDIENNEYALYIIHKEVGKGKTDYEPFYRYPSSFSYLDNDFTEISRDNGPVVVQGIRLASHICNVLNTIEQHTCDGVWEFTRLNIYTSNYFEYFKVITVYYMELVVITNKAIPKQSGNLIKTLCIDDPNISGVRSYTTVVHNSVNHIRYMDAYDDYSNRITVRSSISIDDLKNLAKEKIKEYNTKQLSSTQYNPITAKSSPSERLKDLQNLKNDLTYQLTYIEQQIKELEN